MSEQTKIQWADATFNPWIGCTKVSPGCLKCYAEVSTPSRSMGIKWGKGATRQRTSAANWKLPLRWNRQAAQVSPSHPLYPVRRPRVFCASLADWLDDEVPIEWLADLLKMIHDTPSLDWLLLTKRPVNFWKRLSFVCGLRLEGELEASYDQWLANWSFDKPPANVWVGTSVEDQTRADDRIPELLKIPARVRFLSIEPMLGPIDLEMMEGFTPLAPDLSRNPPPIHWAIFGGESGHNARKCDIDWIRDGVQQCRSAGVAPFVKQLGTGPYQCYAPGSAMAEMLDLKDKKGGDMSEWPEDLRVREFPY